MDFYIGDHVVVIKRYDSAEPGMTGTVAGENPHGTGSLAIKLDAPYNMMIGHDCDEQLPDGDGYYIKPNYLSLVLSNADVTVDVSEFL